MDFFVFVLGCFWWPAEQIPVLTDVGAGGQMLLFALRAAERSGCSENPSTMETRVF